MEDIWLKLVSPENFCQYESCLAGKYRLQEAGVMDIVNPDKISYAANKYVQEHKVLKLKQMAKSIEELVLSTPWNLSQSYILNWSANDMMVIKGIGDPSKGKGGYSFLKQPLK